MTTRTKPGPLVIIGGGEDREGEKVVLREFVRLAGGPEARIVLLSVASETPEEYDRIYRAAFEAIGVADFRALETRTRHDADRARDVGIVEAATGVFFTGGDQQRLVRTLHDTRLVRALHAGRAEGLAIAGTSAGAAMMSDAMIEEGESETCPRAGLVRLRPGLGFLSGVVIDQHFAQRGRLGRLLAALATRPEALGAGIGEDTAMVVEGETFRTVGSGVVTIIDSSGLSHNSLPGAKPDEPLTLSGLRVHTVGAGPRFDLRGRALLPAGAPAGGAEVATR